MSPHTDNELDHAPEQALPLAGAADLAPSRREFMLGMFARCPQLVIELLRHLAAVHVPKNGAIQPLEHGRGEYGDTVVHALHTHRPALGIIVDALETPDTDRRYAWPLYACGLRARLRCPVTLCVVTPRRSVARWAAIPTRIGAGNTYQPIVLGPASIPAVTDPERARQLPELAVLSALVHGRSLDQERASRIAATALRACEPLELALCQLYTEIVRSSLGEPARRLLHEMQLGERH